MSDAVAELAKIAGALLFEREEDFRLHHESLQQLSITERRKKGITWYPLKIMETGFGLGFYPFLVVENPGEKHRHYFQAANPVSLFSMTEENEGEAIRGIIGYVSDSQMKITFFLDELPDWVNEGKIGVNLQFDAHAYDEMAKALSVFINAEKGRHKVIRDVLLGYREATFIPEKPHVFLGLNESQSAAVQRILEAQDIAVLHGPPGTGKTTTLSVAIKELVAREDQVLVCAPSNAAVDLLTRKLAALGLNTVRIGNLSRVEEDTTQHTLDVLIQQERDFKKIKELKKNATELRKLGGKYKRKFGREEAEQRKLIFKEAKNISREARDLENYMIQRVLDHAQVITCTLIGAAHPFLENRKFKTLVIDEAGQALDPACWVAILRAEKVVMAGDPYQLPPTVKSDGARREGLDITLLEKLIQRQHGVSLLQMQYRMNEQIMQFSNLYFYQGKLEANERVRYHHLLFSPQSLEFIDTAGCGFEEKENAEGASKSNPEEAQIVFRHFEALSAVAHGVFSTGIISPYRAQIEILEELFTPYPDVSVNTIDSFQGQEKDVIYISLVRSNTKSEIGFLKDYRRMNVAMTRARKKLVVIGDSATFGNDKFYSGFLHYVESVNAYRSAWEWMA